MEITQRGRRSCHPRGLVRECRLPSRKEQVGMDLGAAHLCSNVSISFFATVIATLTIY